MCLDPCLRGLTRDPSFSAGTTSRFPTDDLLRDEVEGPPALETGSLACPTSASAEDRPQINPTGRIRHMRNPSHTDQSDVRRFLLLSSVSRSQLPSADQYAGTATSRSVGVRAGRACAGAACLQSGSGEMEGMWIPVPRITAEWNPHRFWSAEKAGVVFRARIRQSPSVGI